jgi:DNA-binding SARP family transcriptional activator
MSDLDARRDRAQYDDLRRDTVTELRQALRSVRDSTAELLQRLARNDRLDEHDMDALDALVAAAVRAGRKGTALEALDSVEHLVPGEDSDAEAGDA